MRTRTPRTGLQALLLVPLLAMAGLAAAERPASISKVNGAIRAEAGQTYAKLDTVNGSIQLAEGSRADTVETVNGSITLSTRAAVDRANTVNGSITAGDDSELGQAETVNGAIRLGRGSSVRGDLETVNGQIRVEQTEVGGDIRTVNGDLEILDGSRVAGSLRIDKPGASWFNWGRQPRVPKVVIGANSEVAGPLVFEREVELWVHESARIGRVEGAEPKRFSGSRP